MSVRSFLDTNVLAYTDDADAPRKKETALDLVESASIGGWGVVSTQVLQEYYSVTTRKLGLPKDIARAKVEIFGRLNLATVEMPTILGAIDVHRLHDVSFWDGLVIHTARSAGCRILYTEDLQPGRRFDGLEVVNPFQGGPCRPLFAPRSALPEEPAGRVHPGAGHAFLESSHTSLPPSASPATPA